MVIVLAASASAPPGGGSSGYRYVVPVSAGVTVGYGGVGSHHDYPAADIFAWTGCGTPLVSPVDGRVLEVRTVDLYDPATDNPGDRGGNYVGILGVDGVRFYLAHLDTVAAGSPRSGRRRRGEWSAPWAAPAGPAPATSTWASRRRARARSGRYVGA